jgi:hypothetical protein
VDVELRVVGDPTGDELRGLARWLVGVAEFHGRVSLREPAAGPGEMGRRVEAVVLALGGAAERSADALDRTLAGWLSSRRRPPGGGFSLQLRISPGEVVASVSTGLPDGQLDASLRAFVDELTARLRSERDAAQAADPARRSRDNGDNSADGPAGFAEVEVGELARAFDSRAKADGVLRRAGLRPESFGAFEGAPTAQAYWAEVSHQLRLGKAPGGRRRLLAAAAEEFPGNPAFRGTDGLPPVAV